MRNRSNCTCLNSKIGLLVFVLAVALTSVLRISSAARASDTQPQQQDVLRLENRVTQLEQRLFSIENNMRNLDQQSRFGNTTSQGVTQDDLALLRSEVQSLRNREIEYECALAKLDERTLSREMREARRRSASTDPCRTNADSPLQLSIPRN